MNALQAAVRYSHSKISPWANKVLARDVILSPDLLNNCRCEDICAQHEKGEVGQDAGNGVFVCGLIEEINSIKVGEGNIITKEHIQEKAFALPGAVLKAWAKTKDDNCKGDIFLFCHHTVMTDGIVKLSASLWFATVTNS
jgi:hypothetical protein